MVWKPLSKHSSDFGPLSVEQSSAMRHTVIKKAATVNNKQQSLVKGSMDIMCGGLCTVLFISVPLHLTTELCHLVDKSLAEWSSAFLSLLLACLLAVSLSVFLPSFLAFLLSFQSVFKSLKLLSSLWNLFSKDFTVSHQTPKPHHCQKGTVPYLLVTLFLGYQAVPKGI